MVFRKISVGVTGTAMPAFASSLTAEQRWNVVSYLGSMRTSPRQIAEGEGLYTQGCVDCHGTRPGVEGDGSLARGLSKLPPELGSFAGHVERSESLRVASVLAGMAGTPMPPAAQLSADQVKNVVAYLRTLPMRERMTVAALPGADTSSTMATSARSSISLLEQSLTAARNGRASEASDRAFDAYIAFEPIETPARARDPGVVASMEHLYATFKGAVRANDLRGAGAGA